MRLSAVSVLARGRTADGAADRRFGPGFGREVIVTRFVCLMFLGLVSVGCGPLRIGVFDPPKREDAGAVAEALEPLGSKLDALVAKLDQQANTTGSVLAKLDAKLDERLPVPEAKPEVTPDAQAFVRHEPRREPEPLPEPTRGREPAPESLFRPADETPKKLDQLAERIDALRETMTADIEARKAEAAAKVEPATPAVDDLAGYTGAIIGRPLVCPEAEQLSALLRGLNWTVSTQRNPHFWMRVGDDQTCLTVTYYADGQVLGQVIGFAGTQAEFSAITTRHPNITPARQVPATGQMRNGKRLVCRNGVCRWE